MIDFIKEEMAALEREAISYREQCLRIEGAIAAYKTILKRLDTPDVGEVPNADRPSA